MPSLIVTLSKGRGEIWQTHCGMVELCKLWLAQNKSLPARNILSTGRVFKEVKGIMGNDKHTHIYLCY